MRRRRRRGRGSDTAPPISAPPPLQSLLPGETNSSAYLICSFFCFCFFVFWLIRICSFLKDLHQWISLRNGVEISKKKERNGVENNFKFYCSNSTAMY